MSEQKKHIGWLLYDADCGLCEKIAKWVTPILAKRHIAVIPLQTAWVIEKLGLPMEALLANMRYLSKDGEHLEGGDAYRFCMKRIWWVMPFGYLVSLPLFKQIFDWCYRKFANNRYRFSKTCGLN